MLSPIDSQPTNADLIFHLKENTKMMTNTLVEEAFSAIDRVDFVMPDFRPEAYEDYVLPLFAGQTISQPSTVSFMLENLGVEPGQKVLDVGSGSAWTTALLAHIVGEKGRVFGVEIIPEIVELGRANLAKYNLPWAKIEQAQKGVLGKPEQAPFDRILVSAAAEEIPDELVDQLEVGGVMVLPVGSDIVKIDKVSENEISEERYPGFAFVPLLQ